MTDASNTALRACPFCGATDVVPATIGYQRKIHCKRCGGSGCGFHQGENGQTLEAAATAAWNRRTPDTDAAAVREACAGVADDAADEARADHVQVAPNLYEAEQCVGKVKAAQAIAAAIRALPLPTPSATDAGEGLQDRARAICIAIGDDPEREGPWESWWEVSPYAAAARAVAPPAGGSGAVQEAEWHQQRIGELLEEGGAWRACSGCRESEDGYISERDYPYSATFRCQPGGGCSECGGIGVLWEAPSYWDGLWDDPTALPTDHPPAAGERAQGDGA